MRKGIDKIGEGASFSVFLTLGLISSGVLPDIYIDRSIITKSLFKIFAVTMPRKQDGRTVGWC
ncbi:hypothetical protein SAMN05421754_10321 [Nitrosomonas sp. Nm58]|nr:hypothetical protein SAMN05421754_10321 [Nitrosomonas sp. Nm58]